MTTFKGHQNQDDHFVGTTASDRFVFAAADLTGEDRLTGGSGANPDLLILSGHADISVEQLSGVRGIERIQLSDEGMSIAVSVAVVASAYKATMTVVGGDGNDSLAIVGETIGRAHVSLMGGAGDDMIDATFATRLDGGAGFDMLALHGDHSSVAIDLAAKRDQFVSDDAVALRFEGIDLGAATYDLATLHGTAGVDRFVFGSGAVSVDAGAGDDFFDTGYYAHGELKGGEGADTFRFKGVSIYPAGTELAIDFAPGVDRFQFSAADTGFDVNQFDELAIVDDKHRTITGADLVIFTKAELDTPQEVRSAVEFTTGYDNTRNFFVIVVDSDQHANLYSHPVGVFIDPFFKLADLGAIDPATVQLTDFTFA